MNEKRFKVEGEVWFGNKGFCFDSIVSYDDKEERAKEDFFDKAWKSSNIDIIESISLLFQKYVPVIDAKIEDTKKKQTKIWFSLKGESIGGDSKKIFLNKVVEKSKFQGNQPGIFYEKIKHFSKIFEDRIRKQKENLKNQQYEIILDDYQLKTASRLVVGLGAGHVLETSLTLHHIFGIPYIPASALKGIVRMVSFWEIAGKLNKKSDNEIEKLQKQLYDDELSGSDSEKILKHKLLFGAKNFKGLLVFLDAYPEIQNNQQIFELDVMTPHYQGYYTKNQVPGDWENPNPIIFLTVKKGITFCFNVLFDKYRAEKILEDKDFPQNAKDIMENWQKNGYSNLSSDVKKWLKDALTEFGIGAKTRLGYGIFD
jgi:CRISPR-associated protein Cmr6